MGQYKSQYTGPQIDAGVDAALNPDTTPTTGSDALITSGGAKAALDGKQNTLTFDDVPTVGSSNPVKSSGIKSALNNAKALSFTVTLASASWSNNAQTVSNAYFVASGYAYTVCPSASNYTAYADAQIYADDVTTNGSMTFHCASVPTGNLTVNVLRTEVSA